MYTQEMSQQLQRTHQLENKSNDRTRDKDNNVGMPGTTTTRRHSSGRDIDSRQDVVRAKRSRLSPENRDDSTHSANPLLVVYDDRRKAKEVRMIETVNISKDSDKKIKSNDTTTSSNSKKTSNNNNTNSNKRVCTTTRTGPNQTPGYVVDGTDKVSRLVTKTSSGNNNDDYNQRSEENKLSSFQLTKSDKKYLAMKNVSSVKKANNTTKKKKDHKEYHSQILKTKKLSSTTIINKAKKATSLLKIKKNSGPTAPQKATSSSSLHSIPRTTHRGHTHRERKWNNKWKVDFPWLERGVNNQGREVAKCLLCRSIGMKNSFGNDGSTNLQYSAFQRHQANREHRQSTLVKQTLKQEEKNIITTTAECTTTTLVKAEPVFVWTEEPVRHNNPNLISPSSSPSQQQIQLQNQKVIIKQEEVVIIPTSPPPSPSTSGLFDVTTKTTHLQQPDFSSTYPPQEQHRPLASSSDYYTTIDDDDDDNDLSSKARPSRFVNVNNDDDQNKKSSSSPPQRVFLLSKKAPPFQLSGDLLILQEGLESWTTNSGISSLIESLEGCSAATTTTSSTASSRAFVTEELPSFSFSSSVKSPTPFKKAYVESEHADGILKSLSRLWRTNKLCDAVICSGETKIMLHRLILFAVSPHLLEKNIRDGAELEVNLPSGINDEALATFVAFLYDGVLNLTEYNYKDIERVGNLLKVEKIQRYCREFANSLAEYKLHQQLPVPMVTVVDPGNHEYVGKRKRGRPSKQTVVLNLGDDHSLGERSDPSHYLHSGELSNYHSLALSGPTISRMNSDMPVVFPDSQEYCLPSTSQTSQIFASHQGHVKTEPYQQSSEFCSPFHINPKGSKSHSKDDADHISSLVTHEAPRKSSTTMDIQTTAAAANNNNNDGDEDNNAPIANSNNDDNGKSLTSSAGSNEKSTSKSTGKSLSSPSSKGDAVSSETLQQSSSYTPNVVASSAGDRFSLYSLASS